MPIALDAPKAAAAAAGLLAAVACGSGQQGPVASGRPSPGGAGLAPRTASQGAAPAIQGGGAVSVGTDAGSSTVGSGSSGGAPDLLIVVPRAGRYTYDASGFVEIVHGGVVEERHDLERVVVDLSHQGTSAGASEILMAIEFNEELSEDVHLRVTPTEERLTRLTSKNEHSGVPVTQTVVPSPSILLARGPLVVGDTWDISWSDAALAVHGSGTGRIRKWENVTTGEGGVRALILEIRQELSGSTTGKLDLTFWVDPRTGVVVKQVWSEVFETPERTTRRELRMVLDQGPS